MANNRIVVQSGGTAGAILGSYDIFGTNTGAETVTVFDNTTVNFQGDFSRGGDTIKLTDTATDFTVRIVGSNAVLTSVSDGITVVIPIPNVGTAGINVVFENASGNLVDSRVLVFNGTNVLLGAQTVTTSPTQVANTGGGNSTNTIILTAGLDNLTGGAADDTFLGFNTTLNAGDALNGGAGYNTLKVATDGSLTVQNYGGFTTVNVQRVELTNDDFQPVSIDLSGAQGVEVVAATNSSQSISFNQLTTLATVELNNVTNPAIGGPDVNVEYQDSLTTGTDTVVNVVLKTSKSDDLTIGSVSDGNGGIETVNLSVIEGDSTLDTLDTDLTNLNISGTKNLVIDDSLNNTVRNIDATALTGTLDIDFADNDAAGTGVIMKGAQGANTVLGGSAADNITTYAGNDLITTDDSIGIVDGNDTVDAGNGNNTVNSGIGNDSITSGTGNDVINANNGNNIVNAGDGNNSVTSGTGIDTITTGTGNDTISSGSNNDSISSGAGNDLITIGLGEHTINAGTGDDTVVAGANFNASTVGGDVLDAMDFGDGTDELRISASNASADTFENVTSLEVLTITSDGKNVNLNPGVLGANEAQAAGINTINVDWNDLGNDTVDAGSFTTALTINVGGYTGDTNGTGGGDDSIVTGSGNDTFNAFGDSNLTNADTFVGGAGTDTLNLDGDTTVTGASNFSGFEVITLDDNEDPLVANLYDIAVDNSNAPTANGTLTIDGTKLQSDEGAKISTLGVTTLGYTASILGGAGADSVISGVKNDTIKTGAGNDTVDLGQAADFGGSDSVELGTGDDTLLAARNLDSTDTIIGGAGTDTMSVGGINTNDVDFTNVTEFEILNVGEGFNNTLAKEAQEAGFTTIVSAAGTTGTVIDATGFTRGVVIDISATGGGLNNDVVRAGSGNDTVIAGVGNQNVDLGAGDDQIWVNGTEFDTTDTLAGGDGNDTVVLDNTGSNAVNPVIVGVNLDTVTGIENFVVKSSGDRNVGTDADANQITFENGDIGTLTNINVNASALSDPADSLKVVLAASLDDDDYMFTVTGSSTQTIVQKLNLGVDNNVSFIGGTGVDTLIIDGGDLGSTISMDGGAGDDVISQSGGLLTDDGFVNVSNVEVLTGFTAGKINAVLGGEADQAGIVRIDDTAGNDRVILDAAFNNDLRIDMEGGNDSFSGANSNSKITFDANGSLTAADTLVGGKGVADSIILGAETANITNVTKVEIITVENEAVGQTTTIITSGVNTVSTPATFLQVNATALDSLDHLVFNQTVTGQAISLDGGAGADTITTQGTADIINAGDGNDVVNAGDGNNTVNAGGGNDSVTTGAGADSITGGDGNDTVFSNGGNDVVDGGAGNDMISTGAGVDTITSGTGIDQIFGGTGGDTINLTADTQQDTVFYTERLDSSTSNDRDTITGFESGTDIIDVRYVAELLTSYTLGTAKLEFLGNFSEFGGAQGALTSATPGNVGIVYQQNTNTLWVDLNDDNILNGDDLQIVLSGTTTVQAKDVLSGAFVGFTPVPSNTATVGTIINERFVLQDIPAPSGNWTLDGGLGTDTVVAAAGQDISAAGDTIITNVEWLEIGKGAGGVTIDGVQYNQFLANEQAGTGGFVPTGAAGFPQVLNFIDTGVGGKIVGTSGVGVDGYLLSAGNDDFQIGHVDQDVNVGGGNNIVRTQAAGAVKNSAGDLDNIDGTITLGAGNNTLVLDDSDNYVDADIVGGSFTQTIITESSVTITAQQHGTDGTNGLFGSINDAGDTGVNSPDTITIANNTSTIGGITARAGIENYVLASVGNDTFRVSTATNGVNVTGNAGADTVILLNGVVVDGAGYQPGGALTTVYPTGQYSFSGNDTLQINGTVDIRGLNNGNVTTFGELDLQTNVGINIVSLTEAQHDAFGSTNIEGTADDIINLYRFDVAPVGDNAPGDDGVSTGSNEVGKYNLFGLFDFTLGFAGQSVTGDDGNAQTVRVTNFTLTAASILNGGTGPSDTLVLNNSNISAATVSNFETLQISTTGTLTEAQYEGFANVTGAGADDTITLSTANGAITPGVVTGDADIENFVLNDAFTFNVVKLTSDVAGKSTQDVSGNGSAQTVVVTDLDYRGAIALDGGTDTLRLIGSGTVLAGTPVADISGNTAGITGVELTEVDGLTKMTLAQHGIDAANGTVGAVSGIAGSYAIDQITLVGSGSIDTKLGIENYVLDNAGANVVDVKTTDTRSVIVTSVGGPVGFNDTVNLVAGSFITGTKFELNLDANAGGVGDLLTTDGNIDISNINNGAETTAETLKIVTDGKTTSMTVVQHEGFTSSIQAAGTNDAITLTTNGTIQAEQAIELYTLKSGVGQTNVIQVGTATHAANTAVSITGGDANDTIELGLTGPAVVMTGGTWNLDGGTDTVKIGNNSNIAAVNAGGAITGADILTVNGTATMTELQHDGFTTINGSAAYDTIVLFSNNGDSKVSGDADIEQYNLGAQFTFTLGALSQSVNESVDGNNNTVVFGLAGAYTGTFTGFELNDTFRVGITGVNFAGITGSVTGVGVDFQNINPTTTTMTQAQHEAFGAFTGLTNRQNLVITTGGVITARNDVESYDLSAASNTLTVNAAELTIDITSTGTTNDTIDINSLVIGAGSDWALGGTGDVLLADDESDIRNVNGGLSTTIETLTLDAAADIFMTAKQHDFTTVNATGGANEIRIVTGDNTILLTGYAAIEDYVLSGTADKFAIGAVGQNVDGGLGNDTISSTAGVDTLTGDINGGGGTGDVLVLDDGDNISGANLSNLEALQLDGTLLAGASVTLTGNDYDNFQEPGSVTGSAGVDTVTLTGTIADGSITAVDSIENYILGTDVRIIFGGSDAVRAGQSVTNVENDNYVLQINNAAINGGVDASITFNQFSTGIGDQFDINLGATNINADYDEVTAGTDANIAAAANGIVVINGLTTTDLTDISGNGDVETAIGNAVGSIAAGNHLFVLENVNGSGQSGLYMVNVSASAALNLDSTNFDVEFIGLVNHFGGVNFTAANFV
jgi:Ca2+-binding RTX toxin-like protein